MREDSEEMPEVKAKRDWSPVYVALAVHLLSMAWYFGSQNVRMNNLEHFVAVGESRGGYATHDDIKDLQAAQTIQDQQRDMRANAQDTKIDSLQAQVGGVNDPYRHR